MKRNLLTLLLCAAFAACSGGDRTASNNDNGRAASNAAPANATTNAAGAGGATSGGGAQTGGVAGADAVRVSAEEAQVAAGGSGEAVVRVEIGAGFHVNANPPSNKYLIGTRLEVAAADGVRPGAPVYPAGKLTKFAFEKEPLSVYEGTALIRLPLRVEGSAAKGRRTLAAKVEVQPCNDQECFPPRTLDASIPLTIN